MQRMGRIKRMPPLPVQYMVLGAHSQPARRGVGTSRGLSKLMLLEQIRHRAAEVFQRPRQHPIRNLFASDLEKQVHAASFSAMLGSLCWLIQDSATPTASL